MENRKSFGDDVHRRQFLYPNDTKLSYRMVMEPGRLTRFKNCGICFLWLSDDSVRTGIG